MAAESTANPRGLWTPEEIVREATATRARRVHAHEKTPEERLEETLRLSRLIGELRQGAPHDVRAG